MLIWYLVIVMTVDIHLWLFSARGSRSDSLVELTELVHKGEKRGLFTDKMPARVQQVVREENLRFMKNRDVYDQNYFAFVRKLVTTNIVSEHVFHHIFIFCWHIIIGSCKYLCHSSSTLLSLNFPLPSSSTTAANFCRNSRLVVDEVDLMWFKNWGKLPCIGKPNSLTFSF